MKAIGINIIFLFIWTVIGYYFPCFSLFTTYLVFPIMFVLSATVVRYNLSGFIVVPFCFLLILANDYLFRLFGGGIHDDAGRGWCELTFYLTLFTTTITTMVLGVIMNLCTKPKEEKVFSNLYIIRDMGFAIFISVLTFCFYHFLCVTIFRVPE